MKKRIALGIMVLVVAALALAGRTGEAKADAVVVTPAYGNQYQTYIFQGYGYIPNSLVDLSFISPEGLRIPLYIDGVESYIVTEYDGSFTLYMQPADYLAGASAGVWRAEFCATYSYLCQVVTFVITL